MIDLSFSGPKWISFSKISISSTRTMRLEVCYPQKRVTRLTEWGIWFKAIWKCSSRAATLRSILLRMNILMKANLEPIILCDQDKAQIDRGRALQIDQVKGQNLFLITAQQICKNINQKCFQSVQDLLVRILW